jgi:hypothetical protein
MQFLTISLLLIGCFAIQQTSAGFVAGKCFDSPVLADFDASRVTFANDSNPLLLKRFKIYLFT